MGKNRVTVSLGIANVEDVDCLFRVGVIQKQDKTKVYWQGPEEWIDTDRVHEVNFSVDRGDIVVVDKKDKATEKILLKHSWDTEEDWPAEAQGPATTNVPYYF